MLSSVIMSYKSKSTAVIIQSVVGKVPTVTSMFGTNIHPDLALQCEQGALFSYREAQSNRQTQHLPPQREQPQKISRLTDQVGAILSEQHLIPR